jgi:hypothetical protein
MEFLVLFLIVITLPTLYAFWYGIVYFPTPKEAVEKMVACLPEDTEGKLLYDLGTGDGRMLIEAVKQKKVRGVGYELCWPVYLIALLRSIFVRGATVRFRNFYRAPYHDVDYILCYLHPHPLGRLARLWEVQCTKPLLVVSYMFHIPGWEPKEIRKTEKGKIYLYHYFPKKTKKKPSLVLGKRI